MAQHGLLSPAVCTMLLLSSLLCILLTTLHSQCPTNTFNKLLWRQGSITPSLQTKQQDTDLKTTRSYAEKWNTKFYLIFSTHLKWSKHSSFTLPRTALMTHIYLSGPCHLEWRLMFEDMICTVFTLCSQVLTSIHHLATLILSAQHLLNSAYPSGQPQTTMQPSSCTFNTQDYDSD